jgi:proteasome lid subunit RPN8/RPN11
MSFDPNLVADVVEAIKAHAVAAYPDESVGAITADGYHPLRNLAREDPAVERSGPRYHFDAQEDLAPLLAADAVLALVHSHPEGPEAPSANDIAQQRAMDLPWGIVMCNAEACTAPYWWGDDLVPPALAGRQFRHGPSGSDGKGDCYALIRDWYRIERGIALAEFPREDNWWHGDRDLYTQGFAEAGFVLADRNNPEIGDVVLMTISARGKSNHGSVYVGNGLVLHHLAGRISRLEPVGPWMKHVTWWLRYVQA